MTKVSAERSNLHVTLHLITTAEGGRETPIIEGAFKPRFKMGDLTGICIVEHIQGKTLPPGECAEATISLIGPSIYGADLFEGARFEVLDGTKIVGRGTINRIEGP